MVPGWVIVSKALSASRIIFRWRLWFKGSPSMLPRGNFTTKARGGRTRAIRSGMFPIEMVGIPLPSAIR